MKIKALFLLSKLRVYDECSVNDRQMQNIIYAIKNLT